ncbi:MAG: hypothetical protein OXE57_14310 [Alphaproteobacteria bacterium]|nr:hypothetical protein [Alphaproteobacteria bacterium]
MGDVTDDLDRLNDLLDAGRGQAARVWRMKGQNGSIFDRLRCFARTGAPLAATARSTVR